MQFENIIRNIIEKKCEDYFLGTADLSLAKNPNINQYKILINEYPRAISIGLTLPTTAADLLKSKIYPIYYETNCKLKVITSNLCNFLEQEGYKSFNLPKSNIINDQNFISLHKLAADQANLGKIEENGLLSTSEVGEGVNWGTVLTDAFFR
jgi:epoxyqueuosine reductase QueG